jgi:hypothetical protein
MTDRFSATIQVVDEEEEELHEFGLVDDSTPAQMIVPGYETFVKFDF